VSLTETEEYEANAVIYSFTASFANIQAYTPGLVETRQTKIDMKWIRE
jgi:hypothetical protein